MTYTHRRFFTAMAVFLWGIALCGPAAAEDHTVSTGLRIEAVVTQTMRSERVFVEDGEVFVPKNGGLEVLPVLVNGSGSSITVVTRGLQVVSMARNLLFEYQVRSFEGRPLRESTSNLGLVKLEPGEATFLSPVILGPEDTGESLVLTYNVSGVVAGWANCWSGTVTGTIDLSRTDERSANGQ